MAFPDWPLSHGSLNPDGWWENLMMRLEHGHRLTAALVGILVGVLCAWIWRSPGSVPLSLGVAVLAGVVAHLAGFSRPLVALTGISVSTLAFAVLLLKSASRDAAPRTGLVRWLAFAAFIGVFAQAVLGGIRVVVDPEGILPVNAATAVIFRVLHGCFAQVELCILVALAALLSPKLAGRAVEADGKALFAWVVVGALGLQLLAGATMRHLGAGLAIPTFPAAQANGSWLPAVHNVYVDLNFAHTRVGAAVVTILAVALAVRLLMRYAGQPLVVRPALGVLALVCVQFTLGVFVIWHGRPAMITTLHVVNGAALVAMTVLLAVRVRRCLPASNPRPRTLAPKLAEAAA
jgi:cytochrome c oxidase assembly protein subunit 15